MIKLQQEHRVWYQLFENLDFDLLQYQLQELLDHFNWRIISQLIKGISSVLLKLLRYFNGTIISASFVPAFPVCPVIGCLNLNEALLLLSE